MEPASRPRKLYMCAADKGSIYQSNTSQLLERRGLAGTPTICNYKKQVHHSPTVNFQRKIHRSLEIIESNPFAVDGFLVINVGLADSIIPAWSDIFASRKLQLATNHFRMERRESCDFQMTRNKVARCSL